MYEVVEISGEWIVRRGGREVARYDAQDRALHAVADRLREEGAPGGGASFGMRFEGPRDAGES